MILQPANAPAGSIPLTDDVVQIPFDFLTSLKLNNLAAGLILLADEVRGRRASIDIARPHDAIVLDEYNDAKAQLSDLAGHFLHMYEKNILEGDISIIGEALKC